MTGRYQNKQVDHQVQFDVGGQGSLLELDLVLVQVPVAGVITQQAWRTCAFDHIKHTKRSDTAGVCVCGGGGL